MCPLAFHRDGEARLLILFTPNAAGLTAIHAIFLDRHDAFLYTTPYMLFMSRMSNYHASTSDFITTTRRRRHFCYQSEACEGRRGRRLLASGDTLRYIQQAFTQRLYRLEAASIDASRDESTEDTILLSLCLDFRRGHMPAGLTPAMPMPPARRRHFQRLQIFRLFSQT